MICYTFGDRGFRSWTLSFLGRCCSLDWERSLNTGTGFSIEVWREELIVLFRFLNLSSGDLSLSLVLVMLVDSFGTDFVFLIGLLFYWSCAFILKEL